MSEPTSPSTSTSQDAARCWTALRTALVLAERAALEFAASLPLAYALDLVLLSEDLLDAGERLAARRPDLPGGTVIVEVDRRQIGHVVTSRGAVVALLADASRTVDAMLGDHLDPADRSFLVGAQAVIFAHRVSLVGHLP